MPGGVRNKCARAKRLVSDYYECILNRNTRHTHSHSSSSISPVRKGEKSSQQQQISGGKRTALYTLKNIRQTQNTHTQTPERTT